MNESKTLTDLQDGEAVQTRKQNSNESQAENQKSMRRAR